jgi:hypothetical protein
MKEIIQIQSRLVAKKDKFNKFGGYSYRSAEGILESLKPLLKEQNCYLTISDRVEERGSRYYVVATATLYNADGASVSATAEAREEETKKGMDAAQITGSASSYARKYALCGLFAIDDGVDPDMTNTHGKTAPQPAPIIREDAPMVTQEDLAKAIAEVNNCTTIEQLNACYRKHTSLNGNSVFVNACTKRKSTIKAS